RLVAVGGAHPDPRGDREALAGVHDWTGRGRVAGGAVEPERVVGAAGDDPAAGPGRPAGQGHVVTVAGGGRRRGAGRVVHRPHPGRRAARVDQERVAKGIGLVAGPVDRLDVQRVLAAFPRRVTDGRAATHAVRGDRRGGLVVGAPLVRDDVA